MKKLALFLTMAFMLLAAPVMLFAGDGDPTNTPVLLEYVISFSAFVSTVILLTSFINMNFLKWSGSAKQYLSWFIAALIGVIGYFLHLGIFDAPFWHIPIYVFSFALGANGFFDWELIQLLLTKIGLENKRK